MIAVQILELDDKLRMDDWCRPLYRSADFSSCSDSWQPTNPYGGGPLDHLKWFKVHRVFGKLWEGRTLREYYAGSIPTYEFVRGDIPKEHQL